MTAVLARSSGHIDAGIVESSFCRLGMSEILERVRALDVDAYLVGGAVRDALLDRSAPRDLDLMVPNGSRLVHELLASLGPARRNRHGNWRYFVGDHSHIDVIEPRYFYRPFESIRDTLGFFDASVNALGLPVGRGDVIDPLGGIGHLSDGVVLLPEGRWGGMSDFESVHLVIRLCRLLSRAPLRVLNPELALAHLPKFGSVDWAEIERLNGVSLDEARADALRRLI